ncbi:hypothetical protein [Microlunatus sp. Gsoil 973]|uniref:hypothetical protein n=1 Tax=Microlunatus sp. Gsoil 973 TaxID=2672569 RepID=UPI0012B45C29|nr:hypothetical protein [Microlunatus sp. Gsoil 973]QGN32480.1 hypothetical protein GJV80_06320 [Microlunatus sp. Gsoil 973]
MTSGGAHDPPIILHIGPHKTGTTTLQSGLAQNRARLLDQGVSYPGTLDHELNAAMSVSTRRADPGKDVLHGTERWFGLLDTIRSPGIRLGVLSSEFYSEAPKDRIGWLVDQLGPRAQVVITLRPLTRIMPSQWQQYLQNQISISWEDWLRAILAAPEPGTVTPTFWRRHRHDLLVRRWLEVTGPERLTVIAVDDLQPAFVLRTFEELLAVEPGTLTPTQLRANRSLTLQEAELIRRFNQLYTSAGLRKIDYTTMIRYGAARFLQRRSPAVDEQRILLPDWANRRATELARMMIDDIAASGVRVIGPLDDLVEPRSTPRPAQPTGVTAVDPELAAHLAAGVIDAMGRYRPAEDPDPARAPVLSTVLRTNRVVRRPGDFDAVELRGRIDRLRARADRELLITEAGRGDLLRELRRRLTRRLKGRVRRRRG